MRNILVNKDTIEKDAEEDNDYNNENIIDEIIDIVEK